jgi:DNA recombination protein RmuC
METIIKDDAQGEKDLSHYALSKKVIPVSLNSFYAYLQAIVFGLREMTVEERVKKIMQSLGRPQGDSAKFPDDFGLLRKHLGHAPSSYQSAEKRVERLGQKLLSADGDPKELLEVGDCKTG